jgi:Spx/MgsR family transcriptional regulator
MKPKLWMKSSCTTCRKAKALLAELGIEAEVREYYKQPLEASELQGLLPEDPTPYLGNKSPKFKELGLKDRRLSKAEAIALIVEDNNLLKRPLLVHAKGVIIGLDEAAYRTLKG